MSIADRVERELKQDESAQRRARQASEAAGEVLQRRDYSAADLVFKTCALEEPVVAPRATSNVANDWGDG